MDDGKKSVQIWLDKHVADLGTGHFKPVKKPENLTIEDKNRIFVGTITDALSVLPLLLVNIENVKLS